MTRRSSRAVAASGVLSESALSVSSPSRHRTPNGPTTLERNALELWPVRLGLSVVALGLWTLLTMKLAQQAHRGTPIDFLVYRDAALNMLHHGDTYHTRFTVAHVGFIYPPFALLLLSVLVLVPPLVALSAWWLLNVIALVGIVTICLRELTTLRRFDLFLGSSLLAAASILYLQPLRSNMSFGQINFLLMWAVTFDVVRVRSFGRGALTGIAAAIKLTPLVFTAYFLMGRSRMAAWRTCGVFVGAAVLASFVLPQESRWFWLHQAFRPQRFGKVSNPINQSWYGFMGHVFSSAPQVREIAWGVLSAVTLWIGLSFVRRCVARQRPIDALLALALIQTLVSPISWAHHWSWVVLIPIVLGVRWRESRVVAMAMVLVVAVSVIAPYRWYRYSWCSHGILYDVFGYSLVLSGAILLVSMSVVERRRDLAADGKTFDGTSKVSLRGGRTRR